MKDDKDITKGIHDKFVLIGIGLAVFYWFFETIVLDVLVFHEGTFAEQIIPSDPHDLWLRLVVVFLLIMFGIFAQFAINRRRKAEEFNRKVLESMGEGLVAIDRQYRIVSANRAYCEQVKRPHGEIIGKHCYEVSHHRGRPCFMEGEECAPKCSFETGQQCSSLHTHYDKEGKPIYIDTRSYPMADESGNVIMVIENLNDITEKKKLQDQLIQAQKMESLGTLAGGIAHDFNNMLTAIIGFGHLLQMDIPKDAPQKMFVDEILSAGERAANLTRGLLAFSRKQIVTPKPVNLNEIIRGMEKMLRRLIREDIEFKTILAERDLTVMSDAGQIEQVLINLVTNAKDAMPAGGVLTISTELLELDSEYMKTHVIEKPGPYALISVADTGVGMSEETRQRIFEPFFTTKEVGKGTGLGLSIIYVIVKQHNGYINVYSELGMGTTFKIYLPLIEERVEDTGEKIIAPPRGGTETVLLADDEEAIRKVVKTVLEIAGYKVIEAVDGMDAVTKFIDNKGRIDILVLDVIMPKKNGKDAYEDIKKIKPDIEAIFMSGYTTNLIHEKGVLKEGINFIPKPVSPNELLRKIREVLDTSKT